MKEKKWVECTKCKGKAVTYHYSPRYITSVAQTFCTKCNGMGGYYETKKEVKPDGNF